MRLLRGLLLSLVATGAFACLGQAQIPDGEHHVQAEGAALAHEAV